MLLSDNRTSSVLPFHQLIYPFHLLLYIWVLMSCVYVFDVPLFLSLLSLLLYSLAGDWLVLLCRLVMGSLQKSLQLLWLCQFNSCLSGDTYFLHLGTFWVQLCSMLLPVITSCCSVVCQTFLSSSLIKAVWRGTLRSIVGDQNANNERQHKLQLDIWSGKKTCICYSECNVAKSE